MSRTLRAVLVGCGGMSGAWLKPAAAIRGLDIVGLVDINEDAARERREQFGLRGAEAGTDVRGMLKAAKPDIVFDVTIPEAHRDVTTEALRQGCHVLGEKPLADSMENARRMVRAAARAGKLYAVIQNRRYMPQIHTFRKLVSSRQLGGLTTLNVDFYVGAHFGGFRAQMQHVLLLDMAIHTIDAIRFISGKEPRAVTAVDFNPAGSWYRHGASAIATFEMTDGVVANYRGSWCSEAMHTSWEGQWRANCVKGSATWDGGDGFRAARAVAGHGLVWDDRDLPVSPAAYRGASGHEGIIREFVRCVRSGKTPQTVCTDNIKSLAMVFGAIESAETGRRATIRV